MKRNHKKDWHRPRYPAEETPAYNVIHARWDVKWRTTRQGHIGRYKCEPEKRLMCGRVEIGRVVHSSSECFFAWVTGARVAHGYSSEQIAMHVIERAAGVRKP